MNKEQFRNKIKTLVKKIWKEEFLAKEDPSGLKNITSFSVLRSVLVDLLTEDFIFFIDAVNWVAPKPSTFYVKLKNGFGFHLEYHNTSWVCAVEGKRYFLLNLSEHEQAIKHINKVLKYKTYEVEKEEETL